MDTAEKKKTIIIAIDGPDGSGKTTTVELLNKALVQAGFKVQVYQWIGSGPLGTAARSFVKYTEKRNVLSEILAYAAASMTLSDTCIRPDVDSGNYDYIILDRWISSFYAYQVCMRNIPLAADIHREILSSSKNGRIPHPHFRFILDIDLDKCEERLKKRDEAKDVLESITMRQKMAIHNGYSSYIPLANCIPVPVENKTPEEVINFIFDKMNKYQPVGREHE